MIQQIQRAVEVANSATTDVELKKQALEFLEQAKASETAAQVFSSLLEDANSTEISKFVALQALSDLVIQSGEPQLQFMKQACLGILAQKVAADVRDPEYVRNKIAEFASRLFYCMYGSSNGNRWPHFFQELASVLKIEPVLASAAGTNFSQLGLDFYLKICLFINTEIADQTFVRSKDIQNKNNLLKDEMRVGDVQLLANLWLNVLKSYGLQQSSYHSANLSLSCIGSYISWIDINLVVNPEYINHIIQFLDYRDSKIACAQCLCEIVSKKMKPDEKLALLSMLNLTEKVAEIGNDAVEIQEQLARLATSVGLELSIIIEQCNDSSGDAKLQEIAAAADHEIITHVSPLILKFLEHEYDSVTQQCFPCISQYLIFLKKAFAIGGKPGSAIALNSKRIPLDQEHQDFLIALTAVCFKKMRIDETCDEDSIDELDEFNETIRSKLKVFQDSIVIINPSIFLQSISNNISSLQTSNDWRDLELALFQMHNLAESIRNNLFGLSKKDIFTSEPHNVFCKFLSTFLNDPKIFQIENALIQISFFELIVRHHIFLTNVQTSESNILSIFCSPFGMFSAKERVRLRSWYLFSRFVKCTKPKLENSILSDLLSKVLQLLPIKAADQNPGTGDIDTTFDNQLYLFEGVGILIGSSELTTYELLDATLVPLFSDLENCISAPIKSPDVVLQTHHVLMAVGTITRGVHFGIVPESQVNNANVSGALFQRSLIEKFYNVAEVILVTLSYFNRHEVIRDAARFSFARLIPILSDEILPFASRLISIFLNCEMKVIELTDFLGFLGQIVHMFANKDACFQLLNNLLGPVIKKVFDTLLLASETPNVVAASAAIVGEPRASNGKNVVITDTIREKVSLKKAYYNFLQSLISNSMAPLFVTETNKNLLPTILEDLVTYTTEDIHETSSMKLSLSVLVSFVKIFGTGSCSDSQLPDSGCPPTFDKIEGLSEYFIAKVVPLVFEIPFKAEYGFNIQDGSCRVVACDLSRVLSALRSIHGDVNQNECLRFLNEIYLPQIQFPPELSLDFVQALATMDEKTFEKYFVSFINNITT
ncbi:LAMI_0G03004g1_1 [Lachancea mirantina]|uniref:Exportin-T n=1 Tax=Lachancea mirantina TaxID=1230905 RepID=A0A1G4K7Z3_9SACH|nr:LAMI_0G03004g1_1 [Lachancea mirantina]